MLIINHSADYSANNIGRIDLPIELNELAQAIVNNYSSVVLSNTQKAALNSLTSTLSTSGIYNKINMLLLPCLASSVAECYIDVTTEDGGIISKQGTSDYSLTNISRNAKGIYKTAADSADKLAPAKSARTFATTASMFSVVHMNNNDNFTLGGSPGDTTFCWYNKQGNEHSTRRGSGNSGIGVNGFTWAANSDYAEVCTYTLDADLSALNYFDYINGSKQTISVKSNLQINTTTLNSSKIVPFFGSMNEPYYYNQNNVSVWGTASGLTDAESKTLCDALQAFQSAFFAE